jgi:NitT/TauT family transport system ATP-binding protein
VSHHVAIGASHLGVRFGRNGKEVIALNDFSIEIEPGRFVVLIGPSGCGKSTLLRVIADLLAATDGSVVTFGRTPDEARRQRRISFVFQDATLLPWRTVQENVELPLQVGRWRHLGRDSMRASDLIEMVGLGGREHAYPHELSGGQRQRVAIARALVTKPDVLLMDEPFGALDEITRDNLNEELLKIWNELRTTVVFVTHGLAEAAFLGQSVVVMGTKPGRLVAEVRLDDKKPDNRINRSSPEFFEITSQLRGLLEQAYGAAA